MPWTSPTTAVAGNAILASLWNSDVRDNSLMGNPVFTNEAARDAAITAPVEGQRVYLTAPTVPAATGADTFVPTGIATVYNGSSWVCITPVGAFTTTSGTRNVNTYGTLTGGGTNPSVTITTGTTALVHLRSYMANSASDYSLVSVAVSGATTIAASDAYAIWFKATGDLNAGLTMVIGGLTAGTNTFTMNYKINTGIGTFQNRGITVQGIA